MNVKIYAGFLRRIFALRLKLLYLPKSKIITDDRLFDGVSNDGFIKTVKKDGLLSPPVVIRCKKSYRLIEGYRDFCAAENAELKKIPCLVLSNVETVKIKAFFLSRELISELHFFDAAEKLHSFINEFSLSKEEAAELLSIDKRKLNRLLLLLKIPPYLRLVLKERGASEEEALAELKKSFLLQCDDGAKAPAKTFKMAFDDYRIFKNTIAKTVEKINAAGISALSDFSENEKGLTCTIEVRK